MSTKRLPSKGVHNATIAVIILIVINLLGTFLPPDFVMERNTLIPFTLLVFVIGATTGIWLIGRERP